MRNLSVGRVVAVAAVAIAAIAVAYILFSSSQSYEVKAIFQNASQVVSGDLVQVAGNQVGSVSKIELTANGQAALTLSISDSSYKPLRQGTLAAVRELSLSGIANRYIDLQLGPANAPSIPNGGIIPSRATSSEVDVDELFDTLDGPTRRAIQNVLQGSANEFRGQGAVAQKAFAYLNPAVASSSMLFAEINRDTSKFTNFILKSSHLVSDIAQRQADLGGLIQHLSTTTQALAAQRGNLGVSIQRLPGFMRLADTTFVNLRNALNDVQPLVDVTKPVAPKLVTLLQQLRPFATGAVPTVRDLSNIIRKPGPNNDLVELTALGVPLAAATVRPVYADGKRRPGAFPQSTISLNDSTPELATDKPYAVDLTGWFEGFTHVGTQDANGGSSRISPVFSLNSIDGALTSQIPAGLTGYLEQFLGTNSPTGKPLLTTGQGDRCPGSQERGGTYYPEPGFPCNPSEVPTGP